HAVGPCDVALAWLTDLSPLVLPVPGSTRVETASSLARAQQIRLSEADRARLDERFPAAKMVRQPLGRAKLPRTPVRSEGEVVLIVGLPGAGKSSLARTFVDQGYTRINRDDQGGSLRGLLPSVQHLSEAGQSRIVLDNTYVSRKSRAALI